jgi:hypothetical protein
MRTPILSVLAGSILFGVAASAAAVVSGAAAPGFTITDAAGKAVALTDYKGKYVVLEWTNPECPFVRKHYSSGNMQGLQKEWGSRNVVWLSINSTNASNFEFKTPQQMSDWMKAQGAAPSATLLDSTSATARAYGAKTTPTCSSSTRAARSSMPARSTTSARPIPLTRRRRTTTSARR